MKEYLNKIHFGVEGLIPVVTQSVSTGEVLMVAYANQEAVEKTLSTGIAHYFSRSRQVLWAKGETSGNRQFVKGVMTDCDGDAVLYLVEQIGVACHTQQRSCFFQVIQEPILSPLPFRLLVDLQELLQSRQGGDFSTSYVARLLQGGPDLIGNKILEEAHEYVESLRKEEKASTIHEMTDLLFHAIVGLVYKKIPLQEIFQELGRRFGTSGLEEKRRRGEEG